MIKIDTLYCRFGKKSVLEDISLTLPSHFSILGANGSGKSTLAKALCNLINYDGTVNINGVELQSLSPKQKAKVISYVAPKLEVYDPFITLFEFVLLGRFPYKKSFFEYSKKDKQTALKYIQLLHLKHLKENTLASLSSGEQQLALIAAALTQESQVIILDEPTANLDPYNSRVIAKHIEALKSSHQVILITHDLHLAAFFDAPVVFIKNKKTHLHKDGFFQNETLELHYGVAFESLAVRYG